VRDNATGLGPRAMAASQERGSQTAPSIAKLQINFKLAPLARPTSIADVSASKPLPGLL
jgi:hypothetical protein